MTQEEKDILQIEAYYERKLSKAELKEFEDRRKSDPEFNNQVHDYIEIIKEVKSFGMDDFQNKLDTWEADISTTNNGRIIKLNWWLYAAAFALIISSLTYVLLAPQHKTNEEIFTTYFSPYEDVVTARSGRADDLSKALNFYNQQEYHEAGVLFQNHLDLNPVDYSAMCYLGISYLAVGELEKAEESFEQVITNDHGLYHEVAQWNLALLYIKQDQIAKAQSILKELNNDQQHLFYQLSTQLSDDLND